MKMSHKTAIGLGALAAGVSALALAASPHGVTQAKAEASRVAGPTQVDDFLLADQNLFGRQLYRMGQDKAVVLVTYASGDKQLRADAPALMALKAAYAGKGVEILAVDSRLGDRRDPVIADAKAAGLDMPILFDYEQLVGEELGITRAAEVIVIDPRGWTVAYRGPVASPTGEPWAKAAVDALVAGQKVALASREPTGQLIAFPDRAHANTYAQISYSKTIAPIVEAKCTTCHQPGGIGPMPLISYEQVKGFSPMIREVIRTHRMPPFEPDETVGQWKDDGRLSPDQMKTLVHWIDAGAPRGAGEDPLKKINFQAPEWPLGKPDKIVEIPTMKVPASGVIDYQYPSVKNVMTEGRWLKASAFVVNDRQAVHHILSGVAPSDTPAGATVASSPFTTLLQGYVPGVGYQKMAQDSGLWVPAGAGLAFQAHYTTYGKATVENTKLGLYFYPKGEEPKYPRRTFGIFDFSIEIPAGDGDHKEVAYIEFPKDAVVYAFTPHSHKRGVSANVSIRYPNGKEEMLLAMPRYNFNWQWDYVLAKPLNVPAGSKIITRWVYDNSTRNPENPDPTKTVYWGEQSFEEMLAVYIHYHWAGETAKAPRDDYEKLMQANLMLDVMDDNMDGKLELAELKGGPQSPGTMLKKFFPLIDTNHDGFIDAQELAAAQKLLPRRGGGPRPAAAAPAAPAAQPMPAGSPAVATGDSKAAPAASR
jgi:Copper type II ascorbate-dependent monooxygenase, C-terminal domain/EF hand/AhpC/TSA family